MFDDDVVRGVLICLLPMVHHVLNSLVPSARKNEGRSIRSVQDKVVDQTGRLTSGVSSVCEETDHQTGCDSCKDTKCERLVWDVVSFARLESR